MKDLNKIQEFFSKPLNEGRIDQSQVFDQSEVDRIMGEIREITDILEDTYNKDVQYKEFRFGDGTGGFQFQWNHGGRKWGGRFGLSLKEDGAHKLSALSYYDNSSFGSEDIKPNNPIILDVETWKDLDTSMLTEIWSQLKPMVIKNEAGARKALSREAKAQADYYRGKADTGRIGYGLSSQPRMRNESVNEDLFGVFKSKTIPVTVDDSKTTARELNKVIDNNEEDMPSSFKSPDPRDQISDWVRFFLYDFKNSNFTKNDNIKSSAYDDANTKYDENGETITVREIGDIVAKYFTKFKGRTNEIDRNDPIMMKMRAAKDKKPDFGKAYGDAVKTAYGNDKNAKKLAFLKKERAQLMRDMEQEAEPEGGPIADEYGSKLNRIDKAIAKLSGRKEMTYDQAITEATDSFAGSDPKAGSTIKSTGFDPIILKLKAERARIMRDMEQEAEPEGGPIADEYGRKLDRIDKAIRKEMTYNQAIAEGRSKMPTQDQVDKFFALTQNETHYLNSKPVAGQEATFNLMKIEPWDEYDLSNWNSLVRKAKQRGKSIAEDDKASTIKAKIEKLRKLSNSGEIDGDEFLDKFNPLQKQLKAIDEAKVDYDFSERELIRVLRQLKRGASTEIDMIKAFTKALGRDITKDELFSEAIAEAKFKKGDKVTYLGHPAVVTATKEYNGRDFVSVSYDKGTGATKASMILTTSGDVKAINEASKEDQLKIARAAFEKAEQDGDIRKQELALAVINLINDNISETITESTSQYPNFEVDRNIKYQDTVISKGYWVYTDTEQGGKGVYRNLMNDQILGFSKDDFDMFRKHLSSHFNIIESLDENILETVKLGEGIIEEELCAKGKAYRKKRMAAGEKSSAYLSGRAVKVCKGQMSGKKNKK